MEIEIELTQPNFIPFPFEASALPPLPRIHEHPLKRWIHYNPGATKLAIANSSHDLSRFQVYNWLEAAVDRGEIFCIANKYYESAA